MRNAQNVKNKYILREAIIRSGGKMPIIPDTMRLLKGYDKSQIYQIVTQIRKEFGALETKYGKEFWRIDDGIIYAFENLLLPQDREKLNNRIRAVAVGHAKNSSIDCSIYSDRLNDEQVKTQNQNYKKAAGKLEGISYKFGDAVDKLVIKK